MKTPPSSNSTIALILNPLIDEDSVLEHFEKAFQQLGSTIIVTFERIVSMFGINSCDIPSLLNLDYYINDLAITYEFVVLCSKEDAMRWNIRIVEQSDLTVLVEHRGCPKWLAEPLSQDIKELSTAHLVLLHDNVPEKEIFSTSAWIKQNPYPFHLQFVHNVVLFQQEDFARVARIITGNSVGLVLGGGSCKGLAHIGVIKVLKENGIPIDIIGGTSAGSIISSTYASGKTLREMTSIFVKVFTLTNWLMDFTFPWMSYLSGKAVKESIVSIFSEHIW